MHEHFYEALIRHVENIGKEIEKGKHDNDLLNYYGKPPEFFAHKHLMRRTLKLYINLTVSTEEKY